VDEGHGRSLRCDPGTLDYFHPNTNGQAKAAATAFSSGPSFTDLTAPITTISRDRVAEGVDDWYRESVSVTLSATDGNDAVAGSEYYYKLEGAADTPWTKYTGPIVVSSEGQTTINARSVDSNGNISESKSDVIKIDKAKTVVYADVPERRRAAKPVPGVPALSSGVTPNTGLFGLAWSASADPLLYSSLEYTLQHRDAADAEWSDVSNEITAPSFEFTKGSREGEGTWRYRVMAHEGALSTAFSAASEPVKVDTWRPCRPRRQPQAPSSATTASSTSSTSAPRASAKAPGISRSRSTTAAPTPPASRSSSKAGARAGAGRLRFALDALRSHPNRWPPARASR
jgi:chitobiase/beta-hexosaminidase-like protein